MNKVKRLRWNRKENNVRKNIGDLFFMDAYEECFLPVNVDFAVEFRFIFYHNK